MRKRKKLLFLIIPIFLLGTLFCFRRQAATFAFKAYLGRYVEELREGDLTFGEVTWEGRGFTIERFRLEKEGEYELKIRKLELTFPNELYLYRPKLKVYSQKGPALRLKKLHSKGASGVLTIEKGEIETPFAKAHFEYAKDALHLFSKESALVAHFSSPKKREFVTQITADNVDVPWLFSLAYPFLPTYGLEFHEGTMNGVANWLISKEEISGAGDFSFTNLTGKRDDVDFFSKHLHLQGSWPDARIEVEGGRLGLLSDNYTFAHLSGSYEQGEILHFAMEGECAHKGLSAPFAIQGRSFGDRLYANLLFDRSSIANIEVKGEDFYNCSVKVESPQILTEHLEWLSGVSPFFHQISGGRFSGAVMGQIEEGSCKEINAVRLKGEDFTLRGVNVTEVLLSGLFSTEKFSRSRFSGEFLLAEQGGGDFSYKGGKYSLAVTAPPDLLVGKDKWKIPSLSVEAKGKITGSCITSEGALLAAGEKVTFALTYEGDHLRSASLASDAISDPFYGYPLSLGSEKIDLKGSLALRASFDESKGVSLEFLPLGLTYENEDFVLHAAEAKIPSYLSIQKKEFKGDLLLFDSELTEKKNGLHFSHVNGRIFLNNENGYSSWIEGVSEGCKVGGELSFSKDQIELKGREFEGQLEGLIRFLGHFNELRGFDLPLLGKFQALDEGLVFSQKGEEQEVQITMKIEEARLPLPFDISAEDLCCSVSFDSSTQELQVEDFTGELALCKTPIYGLDGRHLHLKEGELSFDFRVSNQVREIVKLVGGGTAPFSYLIDLNLDKSHLFGERFSQARLELKPNGKIAALQAKVPLYLETLQAQVLAHLPGLQSHEIGGRIDLDLSIEESGQKAALSVYANEIGFGQSEHSPFSLLLIKVGKDLTLDHLRLGECELQGQGEWRADQIDIEKVVGFFPHGELTAASGNYNLATRKGEISFAGQRLDLQKFFPTIPIRFDIASKAHFDLMEKSIGGDLSLESCESPIDFATERPIRFAYKWREGTNIENICLIAESAKLSADQLLYQKGEWHCLELDLSLPPETFHKIANLSPYLKPLPWENQIDLAADVRFGVRGLSALGTIKQGYYWVAGQSFSLDRGAFSLQNGKLNLDLASHLRAVPIQVMGEIDCQRDFHTKLCLKAADDLTGVTLIGDLKNGPMIERVEGEFSGQKFDLVGANIPEDPDAIALSGNIALDFESLLPLLPEKLHARISDLQPTGGYELSGDLIASRTEPLSSTFQGFLKGRYFGIKGNRFKTLLSEIEITHDRIFLRDLNLSDEAILMQIDQASFSREKDDWRFAIPTIAVQDFRPSLMRKEHGHEQRLKPFTSRELNVEKLEGNLSDPHTVTGRGSLKFINTFKRSNNLLDIPIEIISRLGLDQSILIPVKGELEFTFADGEIFFDKLDNCVSEGKHSRFSLSKRYPSYIGLDGSIHVDIRMKQHVLLRFTQPFMLSFRGTLDKPRYSLK